MLTIPVGKGHARSDVLAHGLPFYGGAGDRTNAADSGSGPHGRREEGFTAELWDRTVAALLAIRGCGDPGESRDE
jgi:hypothetical protein